MNEFKPPVPRYFAGYTPVPQEQIDAEIAALDVGKQLDCEIGEGVYLTTVIREGETKAGATRRAVNRMMAFIAEPRGQR